MEALIRAFGDCVRVVVAPHENLPAVDRARALCAHVEIVQATEPERLVEVLSHVDWVCLAGYLRLLPLEVLTSHPGRVLNIHPALLPKFGGKGMYGHHVHDAVLAAGEEESGCSVHFVTEHYDEGAVILQKRCAVLSDDTSESLAERVLALENVAYVEALRSLIDHG